MNRINIPPVYLLAAIIAILVLHYYFPLIVLFVRPFSYFGIVIIFLGLAVILFCSDYFKKYDTPIRPFQESTHLIQDGLYRYTRNPIYFGMGTILFGGAMTMGSLSPFIVVPVFIIIIERAFIVKEEAFLEERFGDEYLEYKKKVRRWF